MSVVKRIIKDNIEKVKVEELLADEYEQAGYGGITLTKTPLGTQINLFAMRPGRVIGKRGRAIKAASERLETEIGLPNPQITVVEVEVPELNPQIMAARVANALERGVHYRRALFWSLRRTMESGAIGCEIILKGKLRSDRSRYEKVSEGYIPKSGDPALKHVKSATMHVKMKKGTFGVTVTIVPPDAKFPDKVSLEGLPVIEYPEEEYELPKGVEPETPEIAGGTEVVPTQPASEGAQAKPVQDAETDETGIEPETSKPLALEEKEIVGDLESEKVESVEKANDTEQDAVIEPPISAETKPGKSVSTEKLAEEQSEEPEKSELSEEDAIKTGESVTDEKKEE
jgi:small subunit ribosomal protein S3